MRELEDGSIWAVISTVVVLLAVCVVVVAVVVGFAAYSRSICLESGCRYSEAQAHLLPVPQLQLA